MILSAMLLTACLFLSVHAVDSTLMVQDCTPDKFRNRA